MILIDYKIKHNEEWVSADDSNNCDAYCHKRAKQLKKKRVVYFWKEDNYRSAIVDRNFKFDQTDFLVFVLPNREIMLVWDDYGPFDLLYLVEKKSLFRDLKDGEIDSRVNLKLRYDKIKDEMILFEYDKCSICDEFEYGNTKFPEFPIDKNRWPEFDFNNLLLTILCKNPDCVNAKLDILIAEKEAEFNVICDDLDGLKQQKIV